MAETIRILILEDVASDAELMERELKKSGLVFVSKRVETEADFLQELKDFKPDVILSDYALPHFDGMRALQLACERVPFAPFIMVTGSINEQTAVNCIKSGATDYVLKDHLLRIGEAVKSALEIKRLELEKKRAEEELVNREEYFRSLIENMMDVITLLGADGTIQYESPSIERMLGYKPDELIGKNVFELIHPEDRLRVAGVFSEKVKEPGSILTLELRFRHKDGSWRFLETVSKNLLDNPVVKAAVVNSRDITERKKMEDELFSARQLLEKVLNASVDMIFVKDRELRTILCNDAFAAAVGRKPEQMVGHTDIENGWTSELVHGDPAKGIHGFENDDREVLGGKVVHNWSDPANVGGEIRVFDTYKVPLYDANRRIFGVLGVSRDITERRKLEEALSASEKQYKALFEDSADAIFVADRETRMLTDCNKKAEALMDRTREEILSMRADALHPPETVKDIMSVFARQAGGEKIAAESFVVRKDGMRIPVSISTAIIELRGRPYLVGIFRDITERIRAEEKEKELTTRIVYLSKYATDAIILLDENLHFLEVNDYTVELYGYTREELTKMHASQCRAPETKGAFMEQTRLAQTSGTALFETVHQRKDGTKFPVEIHLRAFEVNGKKRYQAVIRDITERKRVEKALKESEERHRRLFEESRDALMTLEPPSFRFTSGNPASLKLFGVKSEKEFSSLGPWDVSPENQPDGQSSAVKAREMIETAMRNGSHFFEWTHKQLNGEAFPCTVLLTALNFGEKTLIQATVRDISLVKKAEKELRSNEERMKILLEASQIPHASQQKILEFALEAGLKLTKSRIGYIGFLNEEESILTIPIWSKEVMAECAILEKPIVFPVAGIGLLGEPVRRRKPVMANDYESLPDREKRMPKGHVRLVRHMSLPVFEGDRIVAVAGVGNKETDYDPSDVTQLHSFMAGIWQILQRRKAEERLERLRRRNELILNSAGEGILGLDLEGKHMFVNPAAEKLLGWKTEELVNRNSHETWHHTRPDGTPCLKKDCRILAACLQGAACFSDTEVFWRKDGTSFPVEYISTPILEGGKSVGVVLTFNDITIRKSWEAELRKNLEDLQQFERAAVNRENVMIDLKKKVNELSKKLGQPEPYNLSFLEE